MILHPTHLILRSAGLDMERENYAVPADDTEVVIRPAHRRKAGGQNYPEEP